MKIAIVNNFVPFTYGGAEVLSDSLRNKLTEQGHQAIAIKIPFAWSPPSKILDHMLACRLLQLDNVDRVIALKFPAYYINHPNKVLWLIHQFRQAYDLWDSPYACLPKGPEGLSIRDAVTGSDSKFLGAIRRRFAISSLVANRLRSYNQMDAEVLYPPLEEADKYSCKSYEDYVFFPSRIVASKRQVLAVQSMKHVTSAVKLLIAGKPESADELRLLEDAVRDCGVEDKVTILSRWVTQEEKLDLFARSLGCLFIPYDEDYGYVSLEALYSRKAVITCRDSGGPLEFVDNGINGLVVAPEPAAIAEALDSLYLDKASAQRMGTTGYDKIRAMNISWEGVLEQLTA